MRKTPFLWNSLLLSLAGLIVLFASCERVDMDESLMDESAESSDSNINFNVSMAEAKQFASLFQSNMGNDSISSAEPVVYDQDTVMYLINYCKAGWIMIAGDKRIEPVLSYSDSTETISLASLNDGVFTWIDAAADNIYQLKQTNPMDTACAEYKLWSALAPKDLAADETSLKKAAPDGYWHRELINVTTTTSTSGVGPLMTTKWGQGSPWNQCVPYSDATYTNRCVTGCVAVATSQMMYWGHYHGGKPTWMFTTGYCSGYSKSKDNKNYAFSFSNGSTTVWDQMAISSGRSGTNYVAILMGYVGQRLGMNYTGTASGADSDDVPGVLSPFGITCSKSGYDYNKVITNLNNNQPVYINGKRTRKDHKVLGVHLYYTYKDGHAWIIDGYEDNIVKYTYTYRYTWVGSNPPLEPLKAANYYEGQIVTTTSTSTTRYYRMNWGWDGSYNNGRFLASDKNTWKGSKPPYKYENNIIYNFNFN